MRIPPSSLILLLAIGAIILGFEYGYWTVTGKGLNLHPGSMADIVIAGLGAFAALEYMYKKDRDGREAAVRLCDETRDQIVPKQAAMIKLVFHSQRIAPPPSARIETFDFKEFEKKNPVLVRTQVNAIYKHDLKHIESVNELANHLEAFALRLLNLPAIDVEGLRSIMPLFVLAVEQIAAYIMIEAMVPGNGTFPGIQKVYLKWRDDPAIVRSQTPDPRPGIINGLFSTNRAPGM